MSTNDLLNAFLKRGCFPHQAQFAAHFLARESPRKHLLVSLPGMGKGFAAAMICNHAAATGQAKRILVLTPSALVAQWHDMIHGGNPDVPVVIVDRRQFRELEAGVCGAESLWPAAGIVLMSVDFAKQADISEGLTRTTWDLLVVDETQNVAPQSHRYMLLTNLLESSPVMRVLFLRAAGPLGGSHIDTDSDQLLCGSTITVWSRESVRDHDGKPLLPEVQIQWITHHRQPDEVAVLSLLQESLQSMKESGPVARLIATMLMQSASSSLFALEQRLNRICQRRNELVHGIAGFNESDRDLEDVTTAEQTATELDDQKQFQPELSEMASQLLQTLENVETDSKFDALLGLLESLGVMTSSDRRVCVFTQFVDTATYLASALSERHPHVATLTGRSSFLEREHIISKFAHDGGILIATQAISTTIPVVAAVMFYDLPLNPAVLDARVGQLIRVGRRGPVRVFAFTDESGALIIERLERKLTEIKEALGEGELQKVLFPEQNAAPHNSEEDQE